MRERRVRYCPHCRKPLQPMRYGVPFGPKAARIIDTVAHAGNTGVSTTDLVTAAYGASSRDTINSLRTYISAINRALAASGVSIRGDRRAYRIIARQWA